MTGLHIRRATVADSERLLALAASCPMPGSVSIHIDRSPDFSQLYAALDPGYCMLLAESRKGIVGAIGGVRCELATREGAIRVLCIRDLKVAPAYRGTAVAYRLVQQLIEEADPAVTGALALFNEENRLAQSLARGRAHLPAGIRLAPVSFISIPRALCWRPRRAEHLRPILMRELPEATDLLQSQAVRYALAPLWQAASLERLCNILDGLALSDVWVAERGGGVAAVLAAWNPGRVVQYRVLALDSRMRRIKALVDLLAYAGLCARVPAIGSSLDVRFVVAAACRDGAENALAALVRELVCGARNHAAHVTLCLPEGDSRRAATPALLKMSVSYLPYFFPRPGIEPPAGVVEGARVDVPLASFL